MTVSTYIDDKQVLILTIMTINIY